MHSFEVVHDADAKYHSSYTKFIQRVVLRVMSRVLSVEELRSYEEKRILPFCNVFTQLVTLPSTLSNPFANTFFVLLKIPGS